MAANERHRTLRAAQIDSSPGPVAGSLHFPVVCGGISAFSGSPPENADTKIMLKKGTTPTQK